MDLAGAILCSPIRRAQCTLHKGNTVFEANLVETGGVHFVWTQHGELMGEKIFESTEAIVISLEQSWGASLYQLWEPLFPAKVYPTRVKNQRALEDLRTIWQTDSVALTAAATMVLEGLKDRWYRQDNGAGMHDAIIWMTRVVDRLNDYYGLPSRQDKAATNAAEWKE